MHLSLAGILQLCANIQLSYNFPREREGGKAEIRGWGRGRLAGNWEREKEVGKRKVYEAFRKGPEEIVGQRKICCRFTACITISEAFFPWA